MAKSASKKIIWAIDPFMKDKNLQRSAAWALRAFTKNLANVQIYPIYCFDIEAVQAPLDISAGLIDETKDLAKDELKDLLERIKLPGLQPLEIITDTSGSSRAIVDTLVDYAHDNDAELIVLSTHARKGIARWIAGSFAENLMLRSDIPLLIVNPAWDRATDFKRIVFPTDFSNESAEAWKQIQNLADTLGSRITLFHKVNYELTPGLDVAFSSYSAYQQVFEEDVRERKNLSEKWAEEARKKGLRVDVVIDTKLTGSVTDAVLRYSAHANGLIALASHSGRLARAFLGSTTRQLVRRSQWPVWVLHPQTKRVRAQTKKSA